MNSKYENLPEWNWITEPTLLLNVGIAKANILRMAKKAEANGLQFRPHFKTHQSREIGEWFRDASVKAITVSSLEMALYFADSGWHDITVAFPINLRAMEAINELAARIKLGVLISDPNVIVPLNEGLKYPVAAWIEVDIGDGRSGFRWDDGDALVAAAHEIQVANHLSFKGLLAHAGHSYRAHGRQEILAIHQLAMQKTVAATASLRAAGFSDFEVSTGDTPTCSQAEDFSGTNEIRPGNFVFYDIQQQQIGSCDYHQIAVAMACPVVAIYPHRNEVILHGGGVHLAKDSLMDGEYGQIYGKIALPTSKGWGSPEAGCYLRSISQEHGVAVVRPEILQNLQVGDLLVVLPVHSCMTADLMERLHAIDQKNFERPIYMMKAER